MTRRKGIGRIAGIGVLSAGLVLSNGFSGYTKEVSAQESIKVLNSYEKAHIYTQEDVLKALAGYDGDKSQKGLMEYGLKTGDMRLLYAVDALFRPAFYDVVNGRFVKNKFYYGALIEKHLQNENQDIEDKKLWELVEKYKKAPGLIPYVIGLTDTKQNADKYGVEVTPIEFFHSQWNHPDTMAKGKFSSKAKVFADNKTEEIKTDIIYVESNPIEDPPLDQEEIIPEQPEIDKGDGIEEKDGTEKQETEEPIGGQFGKDDYFEKIEWIDRKGILSLSIYPKFPAFKKEDGKLDEQHIKYSFDLIETEYGKDEKWNNTDSMKVQYECHVYFAGDSKVPWNIEPHRTETRFLETVLKSCNP